MIIDLSTIQDPLSYCINIILKEAKEEDRLVKQLMYTMLSAYTNNPINLAINAPSGEGKSHTLSKVAEKFPESDVIAYAGMTDKALFHRQGTLVVKNEQGQYESIEERLKEIDQSIQDKAGEILSTANNDLKKARRFEMKELEEEKKELQKNAKKLIDLRHKILIFFDTPSPRLFEAIMPLLSHDKYEIEYEYVDTHNGIKTKGNVLRGWPAVIFAQAIDYNHYSRFPEIQRRFIVTNPKMTTDKYRKAIELTSLKYGVPDFVYQAKVVSDEEKAQAREIIEAFKDKIFSVAGKYPPGKSNVFVPFNEAIIKALPNQKAFDMTTAHRFFSFLSLLPIINFEKRPRLTYRKEGSTDLQIIPFATYDDLKEAMFLMEYANGVRPYILEWYNEVFLPSYQAKTEPDTKGEKSESRIALTTAQLVEATYSKQQKKFSTKQVLENYINPLVNQAYIEADSSEIDKRQHVYYPILNAKQKKLFDSGQSNNIPQCAKIPVANIADYPTTDYIINEISGLARYSSDNKVYALQNSKGDTKTAEEIASEYYQNPEEFFELQEGSQTNIQKEPKLDSFHPKGLEKYST
jgi:hypothetical protein